MTGISKTGAKRKEKTDANPSLRESIPDPLKTTANWIPWKEEKRDDEVTKVPYHPAKEHETDATDPSNGTTFQDAFNTLSAGDYDGLGFILTGTKFTGLDLDGCRDPNTGEVSEQAREIVDRFDSYTEISPSRTGLHIWTIASKPGDRCRYKDLDGVKEVELYDTSRYFTMTGDTLENTPGYLSDAQDELNAVYREFFGEAVQGGSDGDSAAARTDTAGTSGEYPTLELDDETVLEKLRSAGNSEKFDALFNHGGTERGEKFVVQSSNGFEWEYTSHSEADEALVNVLMFYTGNDPEQIDRLFRKSALSREKWTTRPDYRKRAVRKALDRDESDFYSGTADKRSTGDKIDELLEIFPTIDWPNANTDESDKAVLRSFLEIAEQACTLTVTASSRQLSELSGYSRRTVLKALKRLQQYGLIEQTSDPDGPNAPGYRINRKRFHHYGYHALRTRSTGEVLSGVSMDELQDTAFYPSALGRKARAIINVLRDTGGVDSIRELADLADTTPRTVRNKLYGYDESDTDTLTGRGIVQVEQEGRRKKVWLHDRWRENLKEYRRDAPSWLKDINRKIRHREDQIIDAYERQKRKEGNLKAVRIDGYGEVRAPSEVIDYLKLERKYREQLNDADGKPELDSDVLDKLAGLQGKFNDRVKRLANDLINLIRERIEKQREKWGDR